MVNIWEIQVTTPPERGWIKIKGFTDNQMRVIRDQAESMTSRDRPEGYTSLRGFHMKLRSENWDYYDIIKAFYGE